MKKKAQELIVMLLAGALLTMSGCGSAGAAKSALTIPEFAKFNYTLKNDEYSINLREKGGKWQEITPYNVRINNNLGQNIKATDSVKESPMIYFGIGKKEVEVEIAAKSIAITSAKVYPLSYGLTAEVKDGKAIVKIDGEKNICVEINGDRYEMVYIFASSSEKNPSEEIINSASADDDINAAVRVIKSGRTSGDVVGTSGWQGGIQKVRVYEKTLSSDEIMQLKNGGEPDGASDKWDLSGNLNDSVAGDAARVIGNPQFKDNYQNSNGGCAVFNGFEDGISTGISQECNDKAYSMSAWVYLDEGTPVTRTIINHFLIVEADGTIVSNIGDWQFPYRTTNKLTQGKWHNVVLTKQNNDVTIYIDGESGGTQTRLEQELKAQVIIGSGTSQSGLYVRSGQTLYFEPGAVFHGTVFFYGVKDAAIAGSGIIDITPVNGQVCYSGITTQYAENINVEGIVVNDPSVFSISTGQSKNVTYKNVKVFSSYGPSDGINTKASENVTIDGCFIRSNDDGISISSSSVNLAGSTNNITVKNTTIINDVAHSFLIGGSSREEREDVIENITVENIDIVDSKQPNGGYQGVFGIGADGNCTVRNISFKNVRIQDIRNNMLFNIYVGHDQSYAQKCGKLVDNISFTDITYTGNKPQVSSIHGYNSTSMVKNISFKNVVINGEKLTKDSDNINVGDFTENIDFS